MLSLLVVDDRVKLHIVLVYREQLFFEVSNAELELGRLFSRFLKSVSILFNVQVGGLTVVVLDLRISRDVLGELFLGFR
jgi:hypothetical protein